MRALIVVDMLNDFCEGALDNAAIAERITPPIRRLVEHARRHDDWVVVYANDAHEAGDPDVRLWGPHALAGTPGAQVIDALAPVGGDREIVAPKRAYSAFENKQLAERLRGLGVREVVLTGQHTDGCVRHTAYDAFELGMAITVAADACGVFPSIDHDEALEYLRRAYGATITDSASIIEGASPSASEASPRPVVAPAPPIGFHGALLHIHRCEVESEEMESLDEATLIVDAGIEGDRYATERGHYSYLGCFERQVTLIEQETIDALARDHEIVLEPGQTRRNLTTVGVPLNHLVGRRLRIGGAVLLGTGLCSPCRYLEDLLDQPVFHALAHRGGLCARVVQAGTIAPGDPIEAL